MSKADKYVVRTNALADHDSFHFGHPFNPNSEMKLTPLSDRVGMKNLGLSIGLIPPGKEGFIPHSHAGQEEFVYILSGEGTLTVDGDQTPLKPGDFVGFPIDGAVHHIANQQADDLIYLMGGERTLTDVSNFPTVGMKGFWADGKMSYVEDDAVKALRPEDFAAKKDR